MDTISRPALMKAEDPNLTTGLYKSKNDTNITVSTQANAGLQTQTVKKRLSDTSTVEQYKIGSLPRYFFQLTNYYGLGDDHTSISTTQLEANIRIKQKFFFQIKLPYSYISGNLGNTNGLSDIFTSLSYIVFNKSNSNLSLTGGLKLPANHANLSKDGLPLPMVYQTSLGSTDGLAGVKYTIHKWDFTFGYQHSFNTSGNQYLHQPTLENSAYNTYDESNLLKRKDDGIFRVNRNFQLKKWNVIAGLLFIYHMANDDYTNELGERVAIIGSKGLTLNLNLATTVPISKKLDFTFVFGKPLILRETRPDGLTRVFVAIAGIKYTLF
ncbi:MAG: hypothetical protein ABI199_05495 [Bacteroidia bacterium]